MLAAKSATRPSGIRKSHIVLAVCLAALLTVEVFFFVASAEQQNRRVSLGREAHGTLTACDRQLQRSLLPLDSCVALFESSETVTLEQFRRFVSRFELQELGIETIEWIAAVPGTEAPGTETAGTAPVADATTLTADATIRIGSANAPVSASASASSPAADARASAMSHPVRYVYPEHTDDHRIGQDRGRDPRWGMLLDRATALGTTVASPALGMSQGTEPNHSSGVPFVCPVYRSTDGEQARLAGHLALTLNPTEVLYQVAASAPRQRIDLYMVDVDLRQIIAMRPAAGSAQQHLAIGESSDLLSHMDVVADRRYVLGDRGWRVACIPADPSQLGLFHARYAYIVLIGGLLLTAMLGGYLNQRRRFQDALMHSEDYLMSTLNSIGDAVIATAADGRITGLNPVAEHLTGWSAAEARGRPLAGVVQLLDSSTRQPELDLAKPHPSRETLPRRNHILVARGGSERTVATCAKPIQTADGGVLGTVLVCRDVTEQCQLEEHLRQSHKLESIGKLAGGVAHDFNNLLAGIMGYADILEHHPSTDPEVQVCVRGITDTSERARELIRQLLTFSRKTPRAMVSLDLHRTLHDTASMLQRTLDSRIKVHLNLRAPKAKVAGDMTLLQNALLNLAVNAGDAMPQGGTLTFATSVVQLDADFWSRQPEPPDVRPGSFLELIVADTGKGMDLETRSHIFEPFFTTKPEGQGTGFGLATVYGTVRDHGGFISVGSEPGRGTVFKVYLPLLDQGAEVPLRATATQRGTILLVDDEPVTTITVHKQLQSLGFSVLTAADGQSAVDLYRTRHGEIDAVILDMVMPGLDGNATYDALRAIQPNVKVVLASAFTGSLRVEEMISRGVHGVLAKPFTTTELRMELGSALRF